MRTVDIYRDAPDRYVGEVENHRYGGVASRVVVDRFCFPTFAEARAYVEETYRGKVRLRRKASGWFVGRVPG